MAVYTREDGSRYQVVLAQKRGDSFYAGRAGWHWHNLDDDSAVVITSIGGPFVSMEAAAEAAHKSRIHLLIKQRPGRYTYGKWTIVFDPKPIPTSCGVDWDYYHENYDGEPGPLSGYAASPEACLAEILSAEEELGAAR